MPLVDLTSNTFTFTVESERSGASFLFVRSERRSRERSSSRWQLNTEDEGLYRKSNDRRSSVASYRAVVLHSFRSKLSFRGFRQQDRVIKIPAMKLFTIRVRNNFYLCSQVPEVLQAVTTRHWCCSALSADVSVNKGSSFMIIPRPTSHLAAQQTMYLPRETLASAVIIITNCATPRQNQSFEVARCKVARPLLVDVRALR